MCFLCVYYVYYVYMGQVPEIKLMYVCMYVCSGVCIYTKLLYTYLYLYLLYLPFLTVCFGFIRDFWYAVYCMCTVLFRSSLVSLLNVRHILSFWIRLLRYT